MNRVGGLAAAALAALALTLAAAAPAARAQAGRAAESPPAMLLIAAPQLTDAPFRETVVLIIRHGRGGPLGVIVNRPLAAKVADVLRKPAASPLAERPLYFGGPVDTQRLIALYRDNGPQPRESLAVADGLWLSQSVPLIDTLLGKPPSAFKLFAGFAGWAPGQLEREIARGDWYLLPLDEEAVFGGDEAGLWKKLIQRASERRAAGTTPQRDA